MNPNPRATRFVLIAFTIYLSGSLLQQCIGFSFPAFSNINLLADLQPVKEPVTATAPNDSLTVSPADSIIPAVQHNKTPVYSFARYQRAGVITDFNTSNTIALNHLMQQLYALRQKKQAKKIRIAYFGDSIIEGDLMSQTFRKKMQDFFGGDGVGFVPITSETSGFRQTVRSSYSGDWTDDHFRNAKDRKRIFFSGHLFHTENGSVQMRDMLAKKDSVILEKTLLCGAASPTRILVNGNGLSIAPGAAFNRIVLSLSPSRSIQVSVSNPALPVYGISFESLSGVIVDNFSFRGSSGLEFAPVDSAFLSAIARNNPYDLLIFQYGANMLYQPNDSKFDWYRRSMKPVLRKFKNCFPETDILIVSTTDRAFSYAGEYRSALGIDSLVRTQAAVAWDQGVYFYNQYLTMGGPNSMVQWVRAKPSLANPDYIHPNHRGAEKLGVYLFEALMKAYRQYETSLPKNSSPE
jgi:hypothetical protein